MWICDAQPNVLFRVELTSPARHWDGRYLRGPAFHRYDFERQPRAESAPTTIAWEGPECTRKRPFHRRAKYALRPRAEVQTRLRTGRTLAHNSRLQFRSLNHVRDDTLKPHWPSEVPLILSIYFCFRRHSGVGRTCNWFDPAANDPKPTLSSRIDGHARAMKDSVLRAQGRFDALDQLLPQGRYRP